jgi:hypothetical protein
MKIFTSEIIYILDDFFGQIRNVIQTYDIIKKSGGSIIDKIKINPLVASYGCNYQIKRGSDLSITIMFAR